MMPLIQKYWWKVLTAIVVGTAAWVTLNNKVSSQEVRLTKVEDKQEKHQSLLDKQEEFNKNMIESNKEVSRKLDKIIFGMAKLR